MYQQPPGYAGQPPPAPPEGGLYPQPGAVGTYNQLPPQMSAPPAMPPQHLPQQPIQMLPQQPQMGYPPPPFATQHTFVQQPGATVTTLQPMAIPTNTVVIQQHRPKPENYMVMAIMVTFFCNCPLGVLAWIFSCLSDTSFNEGDETEARKRGRVSMWISVAGIISTVALVIIIPAAIFGATVDKASDWSTSLGNCGQNYHGKHGCYTCSKCLYSWSDWWDKENCRDTC